MVNEIERGERGKPHLHLHLHFNLHHHKQTNKDKQAMEGEVLPPNTIINNGNGRRAAGSYQSFADQTNRSGGYEPIERDRRRIGGTGRPWIELVTLQGFGKPASLADTFARVRRNLSYFRQNYAVSALVVIGLSLLWRPVSLLVLAFLVAAWIYFYFSRFEGHDDIHDHTIIAGRPIGENVVLALLSVVTVVVLALTPSSGIPLLVSLLISFALIVLHASFRRTDILAFDAKDPSNTLLGGAAAPTPRV